MKRDGKIEGISIHRLQPTDNSYFADMLELFARSFDDVENYSSARPALPYEDALMARDDIVMLVALGDQKVVGALVAYELQKFEQERSEFYIYDLAADETLRRRGIATALIDELKTIAKASGVCSVYVQADYRDDPAVALYTKLGKREDVLHFDLHLE